MVNKTAHGGRREGAGPPRKMTSGVKVTFTLEAEQLAMLKEKYKRSWMEAVRALIAAHLHGELPAQSVRGKYKFVSTSADEFAARKRQSAD